MEAFPFMPRGRNPAAGPDRPGPGDDGLFRGSSPREVLFRLADGDPLELGARVDSVLEEHALLLEPGRVHLRSLARVAYAAFLHAPPQDLAPWLSDRILSAARELLEEDREAEQAGGLPPSVPSTFAHFVATFGVEPGIARRVSVVFHDLPFLQRQLVRAALEDGSRLTELARRFGRPVDDLKTELRNAVESLQRAAGSPLAGRLGGEIDD